MNGFIEVVLTDITQSGRDKQGRTLRRYSDSERTGGERQVT